jgi:hypothetical protein
MSNYTKSTNFATKDNLSPGNPLKIVKGAEIDTEFNNIQTAVATKTDNASANITGGSITGITDLAVADGGTGASTAAGGLNNLLPSQTGNANKYLQTDGTNASWDAVSLSTSDITGTLPVANGGTGVTSSTGTGNVVLSNSPTLVTPALGTPASGVATNLTGLPISSGVSGLGTGVATFLGTPSSANLASALTDETGSGALVFATSPTLVTPALGTPSALVGTNITGTAAGLTAGNVTTNANLTGAITSTGNATSLGSFSSANLLAALTDETGTGANVFATSPTLVTPILGTPTSATLTNATGLPLTTGVTGQLPVANGGTGTATPSIVAGSNITVTGTWPNQTIAASAGGSGTVTSVAATVPSVFSVSGSPITTSGTLALTYSGTALPIANGGTGQTSYTDGQLLIGNSTGNTLTKATLTAGTNVTITNAAGAITIAASGGGVSAATPTALGTVYGKTDSSNTFLGYQVGIGSSTNNTALGYQAYYNLGTSNGNNTAVGSLAGYSVTSGGVDAFGWKAGYSTTTGGLNAAFGPQSLQDNTTGSSNCAFGYNALQSNTTSSDNTAIGYKALYAYSSADGTNTAVGYKANTANVSGNANTAVGWQSLYQQSSGYNNTGVGWQSLPNLTTGLNNTSLGSYSGRTITSGQNCIYIGYNTTASSGGVDSELVIASGGFTGKGNSTGLIGVSGGGVYQGNNSTLWSVTSDQRLKKNIVDNNIGLEKLTQIQVRNFEYRLPEEITELPQNQAIDKNGVQLGVIAQELQAVLPECVKVESTGVMSVDADNLTWYMINAIKQLTARVKQLEGN